MKIQPPCSENNIDTAEKAVGYPFPKELRKLLLEMNGNKYLLLSIDEIVDKSNSTEKLRKNTTMKNLQKNWISSSFFAGNGCGDYYCYHANADGVIDEDSIYIWEHEEYCWKQVASNMAELLSRYYHDEI